MMRRGFTLLEVNLAIFVMATGVLGMCALYSFGFQENRQSVEDVAAVAFADSYLAPLVQGLSATNMTWSKWCEVGETASGDRARVAHGVWPANGWLDYVEQDNETYRVRPGPEGRADTVFGDLNKKIPELYQGVKPSIDGNFSYGLVVTRSGARIQLAFRASRRRDLLMAQPVIVSEVHFQGVPGE